ncbi:uncharacterized protein K452DRAFT_64194 [Aplosporella prunicola CBS 121167]|uniref:Uncharacterized protein n=1 Tax=Aplosporella prunicola CBS 121167 TaxID=1176127 RepID=A0A6A6B8T1_9PEZI|nr:uncharacterized protein K452DRAFT_64194 [Aplosporella prunicola CBS 121167]KAF2139695.1 hypothetical protein K452DRAFT_64194 [Aplosporella prunicola CBS 121167]
MSWCWCGHDLPRLAMGAGCLQYLIRSFQCLQLLFVYLRTVLYSTVRHLAKKAMAMFIHSGLLARRYLHIIPFKFTLPSKQPQQQRQDVHSPPSPHPTPSIRTVPNPKFCYLSTYVQEGLNKKKHTPTKHLLPFLLLFPPFPSADDNDDDGDDDISKQ